ncbi:translation initiation factor IF-3 [bacterium]|nr:translation initiation factor IF-3 [bacterium]
MPNKIFCLSCNGYYKCIHFFITLEVLTIANNNSNEQLVNENIKIPEVMVIGPNGEKMGLKKIADALTLANYAGLDLVLMNANGNPAVAKIMDYNKFRYEKQKKLKETQKKQREANKDIKEYRLSVTIDIGDFETRKKNAQTYLEKGHKIKAFIRFKGRQMARPELGKDVLLRFAEALNEYSVIETEPKLEGRQMFLILAPKKGEGK